MIGFKTTDIGLIPFDWEAVRFQEVAELRHGHQFRNYDFTEDGLKVIKITQIKSDGKIDLSSCSYIDGNRLDEFKNDIIVKGDILVALTGATIGKIARYNSSEIVLQNYRVGNFFSNDEKILNKDFLFQFLRSNYFFNQILARQTQSAQQNIGKDEINNMTLFLPNIEEQRAISSILTALDDKIELLQAQNKTLEETAQTIFAEWFGKYQIEDELPEGWRVGKLGDIIEIYDSLRIPLSKNVREQKKGIYPYHGATSVMDFVDDYLFDGIYLLMAEDGSVIDDNGNPFLQYVWDKFWVNNHAHVLRGKNGYSTEMLFILFKKMNVSTMITGAVQLKINQGNLLGFEIIIPSEELLLKFDNLIQPLFEKFRTNTEQIKTLTQTREELLPRLISGEVRVKEFKNKNN